jgi:hypothetical protein
MRSRPRYRLSGNTCDDCNRARHGEHTTNQRRSLSLICSLPLRSRKHFQTRNVPLEREEPSRLVSQYNIKPAVVARPCGPQFLPLRRRRTAPSLPRPCRGTPGARPTSRRRKSAPTGGRFRGGETVPAGHRPRLDYLRPIADGGTRKRRAPERPPLRHFRMPSVFGSKRTGSYWLGAIWMTTTPRTKSIATTEIGPTALPGLADW